VPLDPRVSRMGDKGTPPVSGAEAFPAADALRQLAHRVAAGVSVLQYQGDGSPAGGRR